MIIALSGNSFSLSRIPSGVQTGRYTAIGGGVTFITNEEHPSILNRRAVANYNFREMFGCALYPACGTRGLTTIGNDVWIGTNAIILDGVTIGDGAIIGAGAVIGSDVLPYTVAVGNPWRIARMRFTPVQTAKLLAIQWWMWDRAVIEDRIEDFLDIDKFIQKYA